MCSTRSNNWRQKPSKMECSKQQYDLTLYSLMFLFILGFAKGKIIEGDIHVNEVEVQTLSGYTIQTKTWNSGQVPYFLDSRLNSTTLENIKTAMQTIQYKTNNCVRFFARTSSNIDYLNITNSNSGCYSSVGRVGGGQIVNIGPGCDTVGIIMHELLHALGFWHEQSRTDRDNYVDILYDNIQRDKIVEFKTRSDTTGVQARIKYDFYSILHYKYNQFAWEKSLDTIVPKSKYSEVDKTELGQRERLSAKDQQRILLLYGCDVVSCGRPNTDNVDFSPVQTTYNVGSSINFSCSIGTLYGTKSSECMSNGHWSAEEPVCFKSTILTAVCSAPNIKNVTVSPYQYTYHVGDSVKFSCSQGTLIGVTSSTCMSNGQWSGTKPYCVRSYTKSFHFCDMGNCLGSWTLSSFMVAKWQRHSGPTPTEGTGPNTDHTNQNDTGLYLLMEATDVPRSQFAIAFSPRVYGQGTGTFSVCMTFYYYMYGEDLDSSSSLFVIIGWNSVWHRFGSTEVGKWTQVVIGEVQITSSYTYAVIFTRKGNDRDKADVAIDDVFIGPCDEVYQYSNITASTNSKPTEYDILNG